MFTEERVLSIVDCPEPTCTQLMILVQTGPTEYTIEHAADAPVAYAFPANTLSNVVLEYTRQVHPELSAQVERGGMR